MSQLIMRYAVLFSLVGASFNLPLFYVEKDWTALAFSIYTVLLSGYLIGGWIAPERESSHD